MLCPRCGGDLGEELGLCARCQESPVPLKKKMGEESQSKEAVARNAARAGKTQAQLIAPQASGFAEEIFSFFSTPAGIVLPLLSLFLLHMATALVVSPEENVIGAFFIALILSGLSLALLTHILLLAELFMEDTIFGLVCIIMPFAIYRFIGSFLEHSKKQLVLNFTGYVVAFLGFAFYSTVASSSSSAMTTMRELFSPGSEEISVYAKIPPMLLRSDYH